MVCEERDRLLADYVERIHALVVGAELLLNALERNGEADWTDRWLRLEQARINCEIARMALSTHATVHRCGPGVKSYTGYPSDSA